MKLPGAERAIVRREKIVDYLLSSTHPPGKEGYFARFGWTPEDWRAFATALIGHARENDVTSTRYTDFGAVYTVDGPLPSPDRRAPTVRSVWVIEDGEQSPRLVTAYPLRGAS